MWTILLPSSSLYFCLTTNQKLCCCRLYIKMAVKVVLFSTNLLLLFMGFSVLHNAAKSQKIVNPHICSIRWDNAHDPQICIWDTAYGPLPWFRVVWEEISTARGPAPTFLHHNKVETDHQFGDSIFLQVTKWVKWLLLHGKMRMLSIRGMKPKCLFFFVNQETQSVIFSNQAKNLPLNPGNI